MPAISPAPGAASAALSPCTCAGRAAPPPGRACRGRAASRRSRGSSLPRADVVWRAPPRRRQKDLRKTRVQVVDQRAHRGGVGLEVVGAGLRLEARTGMVVLLRRGHGGPPCRDCASGELTRAASPSRAQQVANRATRARLAGCLLPPARCRPHADGLRACDGARPSGGAGWIPPDPARGTDHASRPEAAPTPASTARRWRRSPAARCRSLDDAGARLVRAACPGAATACCAARRSAAPPARPGVAALVPPPPPAGGRHLCSPGSPRAPPRGVIDEAARSAEMREIALVTLLRSVHGFACWAIDSPHPAARGGLPSVRRRATATPTR